MGGALLHGDVQAVRIQPLAFVGLVILGLLGSCGLLRPLAGRPSACRDRLPNACVRVSPMQWLLVGLFVAVIIPWRETCSESTAPYIERSLVALRCVQTSAATKCQCSCE